MSKAPWLDGLDTPQKAPSRPRKPRKADPIGRETREALSRRSGGLCEVGCGSPATHAHHRQLRRFGDHSIVNLLHVCSLCHVRIHGHVRYSLDSGWIVSQYDEPALREVLRRDEWVWLGGDGSLLHKPPVPEVPC